ncbi:hypothetical protein KM043_009387 [Ampulex compressa]|nr:hypothetical protein KM043_009387 [Ampulex compressa]
MCGRRAGKEEQPRKERSRQKAGGIHNAEAKHEELALNLNSARLGPRKGAGQARSIWFARMRGSMSSKVFERADPGSRNSTASTLYTSFRVTPVDVPELRIADCDFETRPTPQA